MLGLHANTSASTQLLKRESSHEPLSNTQRISYSFTRKSFAKQEKMKKFTPPAKGNVRSRTDFLLSSLLVQVCWILLLYLFIYSSAYASESVYTISHHSLQAAMCDNALAGGTISGDETGCDDPVFDPTIIESVNLPTGGSGALEYLWIFTTDDPDDEFSVWTPIENSNAPSYNPPAITETTYYRRCARRSGCDDYVAESNYVSKQVACCDNVTDGGAIQSNQTFCGSVYDPEALLNVALPMGGTGDLEYLWFQSVVGPPFFPGSPNWTEITGSDAMNYDPELITQTTYYIRCARRSGCTTFTGESNIIKITLSEPPTINVMTTPPTCRDDNDGQIRLQVVGGTPPYNYFWTNGIGNTDRPTGLAADTYRVTVTDVNDCEAITEIALSQPELLDLTFDINNASCANQDNGSATVIPVGGTAPYTYQWNDVAAQTRATADNLAPGSYFVSVTDANNCLTVGNVMVESPSPLSVNISTTDASCEAGTNGTAVANVTGGTPPYTYQWDDGNQQTTATATNLAPGVYRLQVTDANGCIDNSQITVGGEVGFSVRVTITDPSCDAPSSGVAVAVVSTGSGSYAYRWNTNATTAAITSLPSGTYIVTVTDNDTGCSAVANGTVTAANTIDLSTDQTDTNCTGGDDGTATVTATGGMPPYAYAWSNGETTPTIENLAAGNYTVTVTDITGCTATTSVQIMAMGILETRLTTFDVTCHQLANGEIRSQVTAGNAPYLYAWSNGATTATISNLAADTYTLTVTDASGCQDVQTAIVSQPSRLVATATATDASCGAANGAVTVAVAGGTAPYNYRWNDENESTTSSINSLRAGTYQVVVIDANGCMTTATATINDSGQLNATISKTDARCGENNGTATANPSSGTPPYRYQWSNNAITASIDALAAGSYTVTITDANNCITTATANIQADANINVSITATTVDCGADNGMASAAASGGVPPYTYAWSNGQTSATVANLSIGTYNVTVTDATGCNAVAMTNVTGSSALDANISVSATSICVGQSLPLVATPNTDDLSYEWTATAGVFDNATIPNPTYTAMQAGTYDVRLRLRRADGCEDEETVTITVLDNPIIEIESSDANICGNDPIELTAVVTGGSDNLTYQWTATAGTFDNNMLPTVTYSATSIGTYTVTVHITNEAGCAATSQVTINVGEQPSCEAIITSDYDGLDISSYNGTDGEARVQVVGGSGNYTYRWSNGSRTPSISNLGPGSYRVTVTDSNGCDCISSVRLRDAAKVGNFVWNDVNKNGIQDTDEAGIANVVVTITGTDINGNEVTRTVKTDETGMYMFDGLVPGDYKLTFSTPSGFRPTIQNEGIDDTQDSDIVPATGMTVIVSLDYGEYNETLDAGYFDSGVNVGDYVFIDSNRNGIQDGDERGLEGVILVLVDKGADNIYGTSDDLAIQQTSSDVFGFYLFENVPVGNYVIQVLRNSLPNDVQLTIQNAGGDDAADSDFNPNTLASDMFMVTATQSDDLTHDLGVFGRCDNVTDPGEIAADEDVCGTGSIPSLIRSVRDASGGGGQVEYIWMKSTVSTFNGIEDSNWSIIPSATDASYQPTEIFTTTYYIRCARNENCIDYRETNIIQKRVVPYPTSDIESGDRNICINQSMMYRAVRGGNAQVTYDWHFGEGAQPQTASGREVTVSWTSAGVKTISLNVIQNGCANYTTYDITVTDCPGLLGNFAGIEAQTTPQSFVDLMWMTDGEPSASNYVIQRANADSTKFETIDLMPAEGGAYMHTYHCVDKQPNIGKNYYRVKHFDLNGGFAYSDVMEVMIQPEHIKDIVVYPNPFRTRTTLQLVASLETDVQVQLVSSLGQVLDIQTIPLGTNFYDLDLSSYPKGAYYIYITYNGYRKLSYRLFKTDDK